MRGILAGGILLLPIVVAIGLAGGFYPLWDYTYPWQCTRLCDDDFWQTATLGDVRQELEAGEDINRVRGSDGNSPLHLAVRQGISPEIVELLLEAGADPNASAFRDVNEDPFRRELSVRTPLQLATEFGEHPPTVIRLLLEYGADPNPPIDPDNLRNGSLAPLVYSLGGNQTHRNEIVQLLLEHGADPAARGLWPYADERATALHAAAAIADPVLLELFLRHGADFHILSAPDSKYYEYEQGMTILHAAAKRNLHPESIEFLIGHGLDVNAATRGGVTPLHLASLYNANSGVMRVLLERGANPNARAIWGGTPLLWAIDGYPCEDPWHCERIIDMLLESGADPQAHGNLVDPPLHTSILRGRDARVIQTLVDYGADVTARHDMWTGVRSRPSAPLTPLQLASYVGSPVEVIELLIEQGADVNAKNDDGETALHLAVHDEENTAVVKQLLNLGAALDARDASGVTPCQQAIRMGHSNGILKLVCL